MTDLLKIAEELESIPRGGRDVCGECKEILAQAAAALREAHERDVMLTDANKRLHSDLDKNVKELTETTEILAVRDRQISDMDIELRQLRAELEADNARLREAIEKHKISTSVYEERESDTELYAALEPQKP